MLSAGGVRQALPMADAIAGMKDAYMQLSTGAAQVPLRSRIASNGTSLIMPAYAPQHDDLAVKVVSVFPANVEKGLPIIHALVLVLDSDTGQPLALMEGGELTAIRTGAGSGAATDVLAREDARVVAIIGSGVQAKTQLEAVCTVRNIEKVWVYSRNSGNAQRFIEDVRGQGVIPENVRLASNPREAVQEAHIVCAATTSSTPVFDGNDLKPGAHVNAVGSYMPEMQEVDAQTIQRALVTVDSLDAVLAEAGDLIVPLKNGTITQDHIHAEIGAVIAGEKPGRTDDEQITYFKSVGVAVQDAVAAGIALRLAKDLEIGSLIDL